MNGEVRGRPVEADETSIDAAQWSSLEFGPKNVETISLSCINEIEQIRKTYIPDQIAELADAIKKEEGSRVAFDMYNPLLCAYLTPSEARTYLAEHASFYGGDSVDISSLQPDEYGNYVILISGHRRKRAVESLIETYSLPADQITVQANLRRSITFEEALIDQVRENTYEKVPPDETAKHIQQLYSYLEKQHPDKKPTHQEIAAKTGKSEAVVGTALRFMKLPEEIRNLTKTHGDILPYSTIVQLEPLMRKRQEYFDARISVNDHIKEDRDSYVLNHLHMMVHEILSAKLRSEKKIYTYIQQEIIDLTNKIESIQGAFELLDWQPVSSESVIKQSAAKLAKNALQAYIIATKQNPNILIQTLPELEELTETARRAAESNGLTTKIGSLF